MRFELATDLCDPVPIDEVEPASEILKRFATGAMSLGCAGRPSDPLQHFFFQGDYVLHVTC